jgi:hypothetical protein
MSKRDEQLKRLLEAASRAPKDGPSEIPFGFETRVLASWAGSSTREVYPVAFFQRAFLACLLVTLMCLGASYTAWNTPAANPEYAMSDSAVADTSDLSMP